MAGGGRPEAPELSREERQLIDLQRQMAEYGFDITQELMPEFLRGQRFEMDPRTGEIRRMGYEEWLSTLDPDQLAAARAQKEAGENTLRALRGELTDPAMERELATQRSRMHEQLLASGVTPGSTAYARAMSQMDQQQAIARKDINLRSLASYYGIAQGQGGGMGMPTLGGGDLGGPLATLADVRRQRYQHEMGLYGERIDAAASGAATGATIGGTWNPWAALAGGIIGGAAGYYGS